MEEFIKNELKILEDACKDKKSLEIQKAVTKGILDIYHAFKNQQFSGLSASYVLDLIDKLLRYIPVTPLTGEDSEWCELGYTDDVYYQNKRCPQIFKTKSGKAYNTEGKIFSDDGGHTWYTNNDSRIYIDFPYTVPLTPEYIIIDNKDDLQLILNDIIKYLVHKHICNNKQLDCITMDTLLNAFMDNERISDLVDYVCSKYKVSNKFVIDGDTYIWQIISYIIHNR